MYELKNPNVELEQFIANNSTEEQCRNLFDNLETLRVIAGWSNVELARMLGVCHATIVNIKTGYKEAKWKYNRMLYYHAIRNLLEKRALDITVLGTVLYMVVDGFGYDEIMVQKIVDIVSDEIRIKGRCRSIHVIGESVRKRILEEVF